MATIGNITVPEIAISSTPFPFRTEYPHGRAHEPKIVEHRLGANSANGKVSQRYYLGNGAKKFTAKRTTITPQLRRDLVQFWYDMRGPYGAFRYEAPNEDGDQFTEYVVRFKDPSMTFDAAFAAIMSTGLELVEIPTSNPSYNVASEALRFPSETLEEALLAQVQEIIPLIRIAARDQSYPVIYLSDRRCTVTDQYEPRLLDFNGIEQSMDGSSDVASFVFGNADRVMTLLVNDVDLFRADVQFSLYHVGTGIKVNLWRGNVTDWRASSGSDVFSLSASDGFYELNQLYPRRKISRTCWKKYNNAANGCDWETRSNVVHQQRTLKQSDNTDKLYVFQPKTTECDKSFDGLNGCLAHGMEVRFGGIVAKPQSVRLSWSGEETLTHTSLIADSIYGDAISELYCDIQSQDIAIGFPVKCRISAGRDEGDYYAAIGIVGEGPIVEFARPRPYPIVMENGVITWPEVPGEGLSRQQALEAFYRLWNKDVPADQAAIEKQMGRKLRPTEVISLAFNPHKLDGQDHHGFVSEQKNDLGLRIVKGDDPVSADPGNNFSLGEGGSGVNRFGPERAAGTAFVEIRRKDEKGLQLSRLEEHAMETAVRKGLAGWTWIWNEETELYERAEEKSVLSNPIWIAVNVVLRTRGLLDADAETQEAAFDVPAAVASAAICDLSVKRLIGTGNETQFRFTGALIEPKPTRQYLQEILNNCLGYYTSPFGKIKFGIRVNSSAIEQFSDGNIVWGSLDYEPRKPSFWHITGQFADEEFGYVGNSVEIYDETYGDTVGGVPTKSYINFLGASTKSQVARLVTTRLREELGGWQASVQKVARRGSFRTTLLGLTIEPGTVCRIDHVDLPDMPATAEGSVDPEDARENHIQLRVERWRLNKDYSIDVTWTSLHNEIYDLVAGPKPADVEAIALPREETFKPTNWRFSAHTQRDGLLRLHKIAVGLHKETVHRGTFEVFYCNESTNFYGTCLGSITADATSFVMSGHPPIDGRWIMIDSELMYVEKYVPDPEDVNFGTVHVRRGQLNTRAAAHNRIECTVAEIDEDNVCQLKVEPDKKLRPGSRVVLNDGSGPPYSQQPIASYDNETGVLFTILPLTGVDPGDPLYSDPRLWIIDLKTEEVNFQPRFFSSPNRAKWEHTIDLRNAGVVMIRGRLFNTRGIRSDYVYAFPVGADSIEPATDEQMAKNTFSTEFPHRIRTHDGHTFQMPYRDLPFGTSSNAFQTIKPAEGQPFDYGYAEVTGGVADAIPTPPVVSALVPTELKSAGRITLGGEVDEFSEVEIRIEGDNELEVPLWRSQDHLEVETLEQAAESIRDWCNGGSEFAAYYSADADGVAVTITAKGQSGGTIVTDVAGTITATPQGMDSRLGILKGRRYAVAYIAGDYVSALSPLSAPTGPTGAADRVEVRDIPTTSDDRVTDVRIYATPDGRDEPFYRVGSVSEGTLHTADTTHEDDLEEQEPYPGPTQPEMDGPVIVTLKKNGYEWARLFIPKDKARSNDVHGFALDPIEENATMTVDVDNQAEILDLTVNLL